MADTDTKPIRSFVLRLPDRGSPKHRQLSIALPQNLYVPRLLQQKGLAHYEQSTLACWLTILSMPAYGAAMDVGANVGPFGWLASVYTNRRVIAFEPVPELADAMREIARRNGIDITVEQTALSHLNGTATLYLSDATDSSNSLMAGFRSSSSTLQVPTIRLDDYIAKSAIRPHAIKIDTETSEPDVLAGALNTLGVMRPWMIVEVLAGRTESRLMDLLTPFDYFWYPIDDSIPLRSASRIVGDPTYMHTNWLFTPTRPASAFWMEMARWKEQLAKCTPAPNLLAA